MSGTAGPQKKEGKMRIRAFPVSSLANLLIVFLNVHCILIWTFKDISLVDFIMHVMCMVS